MDAGVIGRDEELAVARAFLAGMRTGPRALLVEGEAGIGKTAVWLAALDEAASRGCRMLRDRREGPGDPALVPGGVLRHGGAAREQADGAQAPARPLARPRTRHADAPRRRCAKLTLKVVSKARKRFKRLRRAQVTLKTQTTMGGRSTPARLSLKLKR